jgi:putative oxidoreductase
VLLSIGIFTRAAALGLFFVNIVAVISLSEIALAALYLHYLWAVLFTGIIVTGGGFFSLDRLAQKY